MKNFLKIIFYFFSSLLSAQNLNAEYIFEINLKFSKKEKEEIINKNNKFEDKYFDNFFSIAEESNGKIAKYILTVNSNMTSFILQPNEYDGGGINISYVIASKALGNYYSDISNSHIIEQVEFNGNNFLVSYQKEDVIWEITNETKKIGQYDCIKAITKLKEVNENKIGEREYEIWFSPTIPIKAGPLLFSGLPGLVVYVTDNKTRRIYLKNAEINPDKIDNIVFPTKGKQITSSDFLEYKRKNL